MHSYRHLAARLRASCAVCALFSGIVILTNPAEATENTPESTTNNSDVAGDSDVEQIVITTRRSILPSTIPAVVEGVTAEQIHDTVNAATTAETIKYLPSIEVRERYIGDRNGIVATRTTGTLSSAQSMVYSDNLLLSNFLGNSYGYPPRWGMVSPEEIERVDVMYGPFSALYPGNSMGGVITIETRQPEKIEAHAGAQVFRQSSDLYGTKDDYDGYHATASIGGRAGGRANDKFSFWLGADRLDNHSHPMTFAVATTPSGAAGPAGTGAYSDKSETFQNRVIFGATGIDHTTQQNAKLRLAYDFTPSLRGTYQLGLWENVSDTSVESYVKKADGSPLYNGQSTIGGKNYRVTMNPGNSESQHVMNGLSLKSDTRGEWDWEAAASLYTFLNDTTRTASNYGNNNTGTITDLGDNGWGTGDLRGIWRPSKDTKGAHEVSFGYHADQYQLNQSVYNTSNWNSGSPTTFASSSEGATRTQAVYLQEAWKFLPDFTLTVGGREEFWNAYDGFNTNTRSVANYTDRDARTFSPKASLAYQMTPELSHRLSVGKAYRFPTVNEMFQQLTTGTTIIAGNPMLRPEQVWSTDWTTEYAVGRDTYRVSLFQEDRTDALLSQTDTIANRTQYENVDSVRIRGVETAFKTTDILVNGLDFSGSVTLASSRILGNAQNPSTVGNEFPRTPAWRAKAVATYRQNEDLTYSTGLRYSSASFGQIDGSDTNHGVYGGVSSYLIADVRANYRIADGVKFAFGVDNLFNDKAYVFHPYPQRTFFGELKYDY